MSGIDREFLVAWSATLERIAAATERCAAELEDQNGDAEIREALGSTAPAEAVSGIALAAERLEQDPDSGPAERRLGREIGAAIRVYFTPPECGHTDDGKHRWRPISERTDRGTEIRTCNWCEHKEESPLR